MSLDLIVFYVLIFNSAYINFQIKKTWLLLSTSIYNATIQDPFRKDEKSYKLSSSAWWHSA